MNTFTSKVTSITNLDTFWFQTLLTSAIFNESIPTLNLPEINPNSMFKTLTPSLYPKSNYKI